MILENPLTEEEYTLKIAKCMEEMLAWIESNNYLDVFVASCAALVSSVPKLDSVAEAMDTRMFYITHSHMGPALISVDYDVTAFLESCDRAGIDEVYYHTPIMIKKGEYTHKGVDTGDTEVDNTPTPTIH
jgi:hypothetical protein